MRYLATRNHAERLAETLEQLLLPQRSSIKAQYSTRYRLAFSLLNEDASQGGSAIAWDIEGALQSNSRYFRSFHKPTYPCFQEHLYPTLEHLSAVHNFSIESQVQYHAPLAFKPPFIRHKDGLSSFSLSQDYLKTFVNSAEWTLGEP